MIEILKQESPSDSISFISKDTSARKKCEPVKNVVFLKTHKTGSSTVTNIFQRYCDRRNLSMALPGLPELHRFGYPNIFETKYIFEHKPDKKYDILTNHARYHRKNMDSIMRDPAKTKYVTIVRDPLYHLESCAVYQRFDKVLNLSKENIVDEFLNKTERDEQGILNLYLNSRDKHIHAIKNQNAFDLGFDPWNQDAANIAKVIDTVEKEFQLVMVSDYMLESLVLLKDELCWNLEDVVFFTLNKRPKKLRQAVNNVIEQRSRVNS